MRQAINDLLPRKRVLLMAVLTAFSGTALAQTAEPITVAPVSLVKPALEGRLGFYDASLFALGQNGVCPGCTATPQAQFYFTNDTVASPRERAVGFDPTRRAFDDLRAWSKARAGKPEGVLPSLVWVGASRTLQGRMADDGRSVTDDQGISVPVALVPKISTNLSFYNEASRKFFANREVAARGELAGDQFVARTLWPMDFSLSAALPVKPLAAGETLNSLVRAEKGGARSNFEARLLWQKNAAQPLDLAGKPALAFILNGAQGDDDEAHGGHFSVATGAFGPKGEWNHWLVNNFYNLGSVSEKGIIASTVPMDAYMADVNSGQAWYRPSYMVVAVLKDARAPTLYQEGIGRIFQHFYRQDFKYRHATANCTGLNVDTMRALGWKVPKLGAENLAKAAVALPFMTVKDGSLDSGKGAFDYLATERTNLYPFVGFETLGNELLGRIAQGNVADSGLEALLAEDLEAVIFIRIPQFPSSRAFGLSPIASMDEYMTQAPANRADWRIVPVGPRPFPAELQDPAAPRDKYPPSFYAAWAEGGILGLLALFGVRFIAKRRQRKGAAS